MLGYARLGLYSRIPALVNAQNAGNLFLMRVVWSTQRQNRKAQLAILFAALSLTPLSAFASSSSKADLSPRVQVQTELSGNTVLSEGPSSLDFGIASRWRLSIPILSRAGRPLEILLGPYFRFPLLYSFSNYGSNIQSPRSYEIGGDIGVGWFHWARTLLTFSPSWKLQFKSTDFHPDDPSRLTEVSASHWSVGLRGEVPVLKLESEPGDRRVEFGVLFSYQFDRLLSFKLRPDNYTPDPDDEIPYNEPIEKTQGVDSRWTAGVFMNFRL